MISIYLDVLIITNIYVNYFLIKATAKFTHTALKISRCIIGSVVGSILSLLILLPINNRIIILLLKLISALIIVIVTFSKNKFKGILKLTFIFFTINFIFAGLITLLYEITNLKIIVVNNYCVYFDIPIIFFAVSTIVAYFAICLITYIFEKNFSLHHSYKVIIEIFGHKYLFNAICDTGNSLYDSFTGKPVVICNSKQLFDEVGFDINNKNIEQIYKNILNKNKKIRLLPYSTIKGNGLIPIIKPEKISIENEKNECKSVDAFIGITNNCNRQSEAIFNPSLLL